MKALDSRLRGNDDGNLWIPASAGMTMESFGFPLRGNDDENLWIPASAGMTMKTYGFPPPRE
jgi:hypothetical protein